jgi:hypothetical protein
MNRLVIMLPLPWSIMATAIEAIVATGAGGTVIAVGGNTMTKAVGAADIEWHHWARVPDSLPVLCEQRRAGP